MYFLMGEGLDHWPLRLDFSTGVDAVLIYYPDSFWLHINQVTAYGLGVLFIVKVRQYKSCKDEQQS
jgi:hypothetical protein